MQPFRPCNKNSNYKFTEIKIPFLILYLSLSLLCNGQELFSVTEPASNRASGSIGFRIDNTMMDELNTSRINYHLIPEVMAGISKEIMVNGMLFSVTEVTF